MSRFAEHSFFRVFSMCDFARWSEPRFPRTSMSTLRRLIHGRVDPGDHRALKLEAAARGVSMTACVGECLRADFGLRVEMASVVDAAGQPGERHPGLIHSILARSEERLAATMDARAEDLGGDLRRLEIMFNLFVQLYLAHTPEVSPERRTAAYAAIARRWTNYQAALAERVAKD